MNRKKDIFELITYGLLCAMFACAFFFGLMYPQYGVPAGTYCVKDESVLSNEQLQEFILKEPDLIKLKRMPRAKIEYQSYVWECLKTI